MSQVGHYLDGHLMFVCGAQPGESDHYAFLILR
jgi:hypothetical protein